MIDALRKHLAWAEGWAREPYDDTTGQRIRLQNGGNVSIGCGRNLQARPLTNDEIEYLLFNDINHVIQQCNTLPYWSGLDSVRQIVVADLVFNLGLKGWLGFKEANKSLAAHEYEDCAMHMADSAWYTQVYRRARKLVAAMGSGVWREED